MNALQTAGEALDSADKLKELISQQAVEIETLRALLSEVSATYTRDDDLPDNLLPRIDAAITKELT